MPLVKNVFVLSLLTKHHSALVAPLSAMSFVDGILLVADPGYGFPETNTRLLLTYCDR